MSEAKFTPGPWLLNDANGESWIDAGSFAVALIDRNCNALNLSDEDKANASLIVVAPKMYAKLEEIAEATVHNFDYETAKPIYDLLAEARGES